MVSVTKCNNIGHHGNTILNWLPWKRNTDLAYKVTKYNGIHYHGWLHLREHHSTTLSSQYYTYRNKLRFENLVELVLHLG